MASQSPFRRRLRNPLRRRSDLEQRRFRRGVYILPSLFTLGNLFCGYACVIYAMRGEYEKAAPFIGIAIVLDMLDGRIARMMGSTSEFGLQFDSLADVISFGMAPAILSFQWGLASLGRLGWGAAFLFVTAAALLPALQFLATAKPNLGLVAWLYRPSVRGAVAAAAFIALSVLVHRHTELAAAGGRLIVTDPSPVVVRILHLAGLFTLLDIEGGAE